MKDKYYTFLLTKHIKAYLNSKSIFIYNKNFFTFFFFFSSTLIVHINTMSLEIRSIGEVISYQTTPRTEFVSAWELLNQKQTKTKILHLTSPNLFQSML